jgi:DNA-binding transcriptional LysR family regulator
VRASHSIDLKHLRYALLAAEFHSFSKAAERLRIKHSTLRNHIDLIEQQFGAPLFRRSPRGVTPTEVGLVFLSSARRVLDEMDGLYERTLAVSEGCAGFISIGFITSITAGNLRSSLFAFQNEHPDIEIRAAEEDRYRLFARLDTGNLDVLIISGCVAHAGANCMSLWSERMFVALPQDHPLTGRDRVYWSDLHGETLLAPKLTADDIEAMANMRLKQPGLKSPVIVTELSRENVLSAVGSGRVITVISAGSSGMKIDNVVFRPLFDPTGPHVITFSAYWRKDNGNPALNTFLNFVRARYALSPADG